MIWQNPWAAIGLLALAIPLIIHFLGRRSARIRRFPTLRFIGAARLMAASWTKPSDLALLAVRMGTLAAAVAALAQPLFLTGDRQGERARSIARAIIIDTSESMRRAAREATPAGARAVDAGRAEAQRLVADARTSVFIHTAVPAGALAGAVAWLDTQGGRREIVVISDFQAGAIDEVDLRAVPTDIGLQLVRIDVVDGDRPRNAPTRQDSAAVTAAITIDSVSTRVEWTSDDSAAGPILDGIVSIAADDELMRANAARHAAMLATATLVADGGHPIVVIHRDYARRTELLREATPLNAPWQGDVIARLRADPLLAAAAASTADDLVLRADSIPASTRPDSPMIVLARTSSGRPVAFAGGHTLRGTDRLLLFSETDAGSLASAALIAATLRATARPVLVEELEPVTVPEEVLAAWRRPAASRLTTSVPLTDDASDGRWLWLLALLLLGLEGWMRRARRDTGAPAIVRDRAA